jgi:hypothetical protein
MKFSSKVAHVTYVYCLFQIMNKFRHFRKQKSFIFCTFLSVVTEMHFFFNLSYNREGRYNISKEKLRHTDL